MTAEGCQLVEGGRRDIGQSSGPGGHKQSPAHVDFAVDGGHGCDTGKVHENEQHVGDGADLAVKQLAHGTKDTGVNALFRRCGFDIAGVANIKPQWIGQAVSEAGQIVGNGRNSFT